MNEKAGRYSGMDRYEARKAIIEDFKKAGLLVKIEKRACCRSLLPLQDGGGTNDYETVVCKDETSGRTGHGSSDFRKDEICS